MEELEKFKNLGHGKLDFTIGSALDLFGGTIPYKKSALFVNENVNKAEQKHELVEFMES